MEERGDNPYPRFNIRNLMRIPHLVPHVFTFDFRGGIDDGLLIAYSGTGLDRKYGFNVSGTTLDNIYLGDDNKNDVLNGYRRVYLDKTTFYSHRTIRIGQDEWSPDRVAESLMFPCSENQRDIDFGWGMVIFELVETTVRNVYRSW